MKATIKFIDADLANGRTEIMVGIKRITIDSRYWKAIREAVSKGGRVITLYPFVGYMNVTPAMVYERRFASEIKTILKIATL